MADAVASGADVRQAFGRTIQAVWTDDGQDEPLVVAHDLPDDLSSACPHDGALLAARASVTRADACDTLVQFSVFGGNPVVATASRGVR
jgi:hypothetical protein